jgi:hypothetical protein
MYYTHMDKAVEQIMNYKDIEETDLIFSKLNPNSISKFSVFLIFFNKKNLREINLDDEENLHYY